MTGHMDETTDHLLTLRRSTGEAHRDIFRACQELRDLASVHYLAGNERLSTELGLLAAEIQNASDTIRGNDAEAINTELKRGERFNASLIKALVDSLPDSNGARE